MKAKLAILIGLVVVLPISAVAGSALLTEDNPSPKPVVNLWENGCYANDPPPPCSGAK
jgi:hypothetical protein